jgi:hypothetical protein
MTFQSSKTSKHCEKANFKAVKTSISHPMIIFGNAELRKGTGDRKLNVSLVLMSIHRDISMSEVVRFPA